MAKIKNSILFTGVVLGVGIGSRHLLINYRNQELNSAVIEVALHSTFNSPGMGEIESIPFNETWKHMEFNVYIRTPIKKASYTPRKLNHMDVNTTHSTSKKHRSKSTQQTKPYVLTMSTKNSKINENQKILATLQTNHRHLIEKSIYIKKDIEDIAIQIRELGQQKSSIDNEIIQTKNALKNSKEIKKSLIQSSQLLKDSLSTYQNNCSKAQQLLNDSKTKLDDAEIALQSANKQKENIKNLINQIESQQTYKNQSLKRSKNSLTNTIKEIEINQKSLEQNIQDIKIKKQAINQKNLIIQTKRSEIIKQNTKIKSKIDEILQQSLIVNSHKNVLLKKEEALAQVKAITSRIVGFLEAQTTAQQAMQIEFQKKSNYEDQLVSANSSEQAHLHRLIDRHAGAAESMRIQMIDFQTASTNMAIALIPEKEKEERLMQEISQATKEKNDAEEKEKQLKKQKRSLELQKQLSTKEKDDLEDQNKLLKTDHQLLISNKNILNANKSTLTQRTKYYQNSKLKYQKEISELNMTFQQANNDLLSSEEQINLLARKKDQKQTILNKQNSNYLSTSNNLQQQKEKIQQLSINIYHTKQDIMNQTKNINTKTQQQADLKLKIQSARYQKIEKINQQIIHNIDQKSIQQKIYEAKEKIIIINMSKLPKISSTFSNKN